ncbi:hypothetical protein KA977_05220 [Candidatus Dependentiae bacterium]|nr:hypothetical protein [Candidatus Dependentiae bacterium]
MNSQKILFYISSHGFGHFARDIIIINHLLAKNAELFVKSGIPENFFSNKIPEHYKNKFHYFETITDAGCTQKDFINIDIKKTLFEMKTVFENNYLKIKSEIDFIKKKNISGIISDASSFPLLIAKKSGIKNCLVTNFTWFDIYSHFPNKLKTGYNHIIDSLMNEYSCAEIQFFPGIITPNNYILNQKCIGFISGEGTDCRNKIYKKYNLKKKKICYIYFGEPDKSKFNWKNLRDNDDYIFITKDSIETDANVDNLIIVDDDSIGYTDMIASSDAVCSKLGYSTIALCLRHKKPLIYCERKNFYEFDFLKKFIDENNAGSFVENKDFYNCRWGYHLTKSLQLKTNYSKIYFNGETSIADFFEI